MAATDRAVNVHEAGPTSPSSWSGWRTGKVLLSLDQPWILDATA